MAPRAAPVKSGFVYRDRSDESAQRRATQSGGMFDSVFNQKFKVYRAKQGENTFRIMPPTWDMDQYPKEDHYGFDMWFHRDIGSDHSGYLCLAKMRGEYCVICETRAQMERDGASKDDLKAVKLQRQVVVWMIDRDRESDGPQLYPISWTMDKDFANLSRDKKTGAALKIDNPYDGYDLSFTREGTGLNTRYIGIQVARISQPLSDDPATQEKWLAFIMENPIPTTFQYFDADYIADVFNGRRAAAQAEDEPPPEDPGDPGPEDPGVDQGGYDEQQDDAAPVDEEPPPEAYTEDQLAALTAAGWQGEVDEAGDAVDDQGNVLAVDSEGNVYYPGEEQYPDEAAPPEGEPDGGEDPPPEEPEPALAPARRPAPRPAAPARPAAAAPAARPRGRAQPAAEADPEEPAPQPAARPAARPAATPRPAARPAPAPAARPAPAAAPRPTPRPAAGRPAAPVPTGRPRPRA